MATRDLSSIDSALATLFDAEVTNQINRACVLAQLLPTKPADGKNITWDVKLGTATPSTANINDGADVSTYNADTKIPAALNYGTYHDAFSITGKAMSAAIASGSPTQLANLFMDEMRDSIQRLASVIGQHVYTGDGSTNQILGLYDATLGPMLDTGAYAGISAITYTQWKASVVDASAGELSLQLIRQLRRTIYTACGEKPDLFITDPTQHEKLGNLYGQQRRYVDQVRTANGTIKLDGGYNVLEFDGIAVVEDVKHPAQKFGALNTRYINLRQLPNGPANVEGTMGTVQLGGTGEEQFGEQKMGLTAKILPLAKTGDAHKFGLWLYPQLQVRRRNSIGHLTNLAA